MNGGGEWNSGQDVEVSQKNLLGWSLSQDIFTDPDEDDGTQPIPPSSQELLTLNTPNNTQSSLNLIDPATDLDMSDGTLELYAGNLNYGVPDSSQGQIEEDNFDENNQDFPTDNRDEVSFIVPAPNVYYGGGSSVPFNDGGFHQLQNARRMNRELGEQSQQEGFVFTQQVYLPQHQGVGEERADLSGASGEVSSSQESNREAPETVSWAGSYDFTVMPEDHFIKQSCYSSLLDKIYCISCKPIRFVMSIDFTAVNVKNLYVKAQLVYKEATEIEKPVERCVSCTQEERKSAPNTDEDVLKHVLRCTHRKSEYRQNVETHRFSVIAPLEKPQPGASSVSKNYELKCLSSCTTINRSSLCLVFTLLENRKQVGRRSFDIKICKCPMRDCRKDEDRRLGKIPQKRSGKKRGSSSGSKRTAEPDEIRISDLEIAAKNRCISPNPCRSSTKFQVKQEDGKLDDGNETDESLNSSQEIRDFCAQASVKIKAAAKMQKSPNPNVRRLGKVCLREFRNCMRTTEDLEGLDIEAPRSGNRAVELQQTSPPPANAPVIGSPDSGFHGGNRNNQQHR